MWWWCLIALAGSPEAVDATVEPSDEGSVEEGVEVPVPKVPDQAEYNRLTQELEALAERNAWAGVERTWAKLLDTLIAPSFQDYVLAANAARALGDTAAARERWLAAKERKEDPAVFDALFDIDQHHGAVHLQCEPGLGWELAAQTRPFQPDRIRSVEFAASAVAERCLFEGLLPVGTYTFADETFELRAGQPVVKIDARGRLPSKKKK
jgi:hypothetical protein